MTIEEFCIAFAPLGLTQAQQGVALLWYLDREEPSASRSPGELAKILRDAGVCEPHSTRLGDSMMATKLVMNVGGRLRIKPTSRCIVEGWVASIVKPSPPRVDHEAGFLPKAVWDGAKQTYIQKIAAQVNGCYEYGFYDGASVLVRRIIETLLIECYEHRKIEANIKKADGNYHWLSEIITDAVDRGRLPLGRETKGVLKCIKTTGDRSAHNRRYVAVKNDLDSIRSGVRLAIDELLHLAGLK